MRILPARTVTVAPVKVVGRTTMSIDRLTSSWLPSLRIARRPRPYGPNFASISRHPPSRHLCIQPTPPDSNRINSKASIKEETKVRSQSKLRILKLARSPKVRSQRRNEANRSTREALLEHRPHAQSISTKTNNSMCESPKPPAYPTSVPRSS